MISRSISSLTSGIQIVPLRSKLPPNVVSPGSILGTVSTSPSDMSSVIESATHVVSTSCEADNLPVTLSKSTGTTVPRLGREKLLNHVVSTPLVAKTGHSEPFSRNKTSSRDVRNAITWVRVEGMGPSLFSDSFKLISPVTKSDIVLWDKLITDTKLSLIIFAPVLSTTTGVTLRKVRPIF